MGPIVLRVMPPEWVQSVSTQVRNVMDYKGFRPRLFGGIRSDSEDLLKDLLTFCPSF
jgi:hypothetical protein